MAGRPRVPLDQMLGELIEPVGREAWWRPKERASD